MSEHFVRLLFRPRRGPGPGLPFSVRSVGHRREPAGYRQHARPRPHLELFWGVEGTGEIQYGDSFHSLAAEHVAFLLPGDLHRARARTRSWEFRWMTVDGPLVSAVFRSLGISQHPRRAGPCPHDTFSQIEREIRDVTPDGERVASCTAYRILVLAGSSPSAKRVHPLVDGATRLVREHLSDPDLNVNWLARRLGCSRVSLSRLFGQQKGIPPSQYIAARRLQQALALLRSGTLTIREIARACGYRDPDYFSRVFRQAMGRCARAFRLGAGDEAAEQSPSRGR